MSKHPVVAGWRGLDSAGAVQLAAVLAESLHQSLELTSAYQYRLSGLSSQIEPTRGNETRFVAAHARVKRARALVPARVDVRERVAPALGVAEALEDVARRTDACLIVVGRDLDGDVTRSLLHGAPCPVAVSPFTVAVPDEQPLRRIGVADDGLPHARLAGIAADRLAHDTAAEIVRLRMGPDDGDVGKALIAASDGLDLLLCGSHGRGRVRGALLGSVSIQRAQGACCPVLVVPPVTEEWAAGPLGLSTAAQA